MKAIISLLILVLFLIGSAQEYIPLEKNSEKILKSQSEKFLNNGENFRKKLKNRFNGKLSKHIENNFMEMQYGFNDEILQGNILFNEEIEGFLNRMLSKIAAKNPDLPQMTIFISKDASANAYSMGDNNILINLGLFYFLNNESEVASVISHEIGHQILEHSLKKQVEQFEKSNSKEFKRQLKDVAGSKYNKHDKALNILKTHLYELSASSRYNELQADSIGYILYKNAEFPTDQYLSALKTLEKYDTLSPRGLKEDTYRQFFDLDHQPFQEKWLELEDFSAYNYSYESKLNEDSISTHPETLERLNTLKKLFPELNSVNKVDEASAEYEKIQKIANYERIPNYFFNEQYGLGVYLSLLNLQENPESEYYKEWLGKNFNEIYLARKNYTLNRYLDRLDPENQSDSYQQFLSFMWNLSLDEIETIKNYYYKE